MPIIKGKYFSAGIKTIISIIRNRFTGYRIPLLVSILLTNRCNLDCIYCFSNAYKSGNIDIPSGQLYKIIDQLKKCGTILITLTGGEVALRDDIGDIIDYISQKGIMVELLTNGINFDKNIVAMRKLDFLAVSVDGNEETHDKNRGRGSFGTAINAVETACRNGIHTRIHACFTKFSMESLPELIEIARKYNVRVNIAPPSVHRDNPALNFEAEEVREYYRHMKEFKQKGDFVSNSIATLDFISNWPGDFDYIGEKPVPHLPYLPCKRKDFCMYIDVNGNAYPCAALWTRYNFNVFEKGVKGAFDEFQKIPCTTCINEAEFNLLFNGSISSLMNVAAFSLIDRFKKIFSK
jgi:MoaA/NifB/PqqE/SkfB family radical SAM enzyme